MKNQDDLLGDLNYYLENRVGDGSDEYCWQLILIAQKMPDEQYQIAQEFYNALGRAFVKGLGMLGNAELALKLAGWVYPRALSHAYQDKLAAEMR